MNTTLPKVQISTVTDAFQKVLGRTALILQKHSPQILLGAGIIGVTAGTVLACKATLKAQSILDEKDAMLDLIHETKEIATPEAYSPEDYQKDVTITYVKTGVNFVKLYAPSALLIAGGIGALVASHNILQNRNAALTAAYRLVAGAFAEYRGRVVADVGEKKDYEYRYGARVEEVEEIVVSADGKEKKKKKPQEFYGGKEVIEGKSGYARFFDEFSPNWDKRPEYNLMFLRAQENYANDKLRRYGHVFLNEVYELLGIPHSQAGAVVGWVRDSEVGDGYISFGIYDYTDANARQFVNGYESAILLDFNVDGTIWDLI